MEKSLAWWKKAIVYQIYPLSFMDSNHDGIGDIQGIISKLDYIKDLGVDVIWLSPVYQSPMDDNGYDISDYLKINPMFGSLEDLLKLIDEVHQRDMKLMMDLVINHTSDEHPWFIQSKDQDSPYKDYYIWRDQPSDIGSVFGGPAWTYDAQRKAYYFHLFSKRQPDLNWHHEPLRKEIYQMVNTWLDYGIDGFRLDVIDLIGKDIDQKRLADGPLLETHLKELYDTCFKGRDIITVGEMPGLSIERASALTDEHNGYLNMIFQFSHISLDEIPGQGKWALKDLDLVELKKVFGKAQSIFSKRGWNSLFLANHDQPRVVSRYGSEALRYESATMFATMIYGQQGTPYIYQGEEIGMTGVTYDIEDYQDIETKNIYHILKEKGQTESEIMTSIHKKSRDNSRTPFQWNNKPYAGFSTVKPWLKVNPNYKEINVENELNLEKSVLDYYKKLIKLRKTYDVFHDGAYHCLNDQDQEIYAYIRKNQHQTLLIITSFSNQETIFNLKHIIFKETLLNNQDYLIKEDNMICPPYFAGIFLIGDDAYAND